MERDTLASEGRVRLMKTKENHYLIYLPKDIAEDTQFPFPLKNKQGQYLSVSFEKGKDGLIIEKLTEEAKH